MANFGKVHLIIYKGKVVNNVVLKEERRKMIEIINNLLLCLELEGDGRCSAFSAKEKDDMYNYIAANNNVPYLRIDNLSCIYS